MDSLFIWSTVGWPIILSSAIARIEGRLASHFFKGLTSRLSDRSKTPRAVILQSKSEDGPTHFINSDTIYSIRIGPACKKV